MEVKKRYELAILFAYFLLMSFIAWKLNFRHFEMSLLYFGIPAIYFLFRVKATSRSLLLRTLLVTTPITIILDTVAHINKAWYESSLFAFRFLDLFPLETFIWAFNYCLFIIVFYEYFFDKERKPERNKRYTISMLTLWFGAFVVSLIVLLSDSILKIPYFYALFILFFVIFVTFALLRKKNFYIRTTLASIYLFIPSLLHELVSLENKHWIFERGYHIGYLEIFKYTIPVEEMLWLIIIPMAIIIVYEIFLDDLK